MAEGATAGSSSGGPLEGGGSSSGAAAEPRAVAAKSRPAAKVKAKAKAKAKPVLAGKRPMPEPSEPERRVEARVLPVRDLARPHVKVIPVLLVTGCDADWCRDFMRALGVQRFVDARVLRDDVDFPEVAACTGESGFILQKAVAHRAFVPQVLKQIGEVAASQIERPGGAVIGLLCNKGQHRSVAVSVLVGEALRRCGLRVEVRHLGARREALCQCQEVEAFTYCPAVAQRLEGRRAWSQAEECFAEHIKRRRRAIEQAMPKVIRAFGSAGCRIR